MSAAPASRPARSPRLALATDIRTAPVGICRDRLAVREVDNAEENNDGQADWQNKGSTRQSKRDQNGECRFRPVRRRTQCVEAKNGNTCRRPDLFFDIFLG